MNQVYRAVERTPHGLAPFLAHQWILIGASGFLLGLLHPFAGVGAAVLTIALTIAGTRRWSGRRDWMVLWLRRRERQQYRMIDPDERYREYGGKRR